jgi:signal transduction histidine kinase
VIITTFAGIGLDLLHNNESLEEAADRFRAGTNVNGTRGTGLGLALVRAVADAHGGSARVRSVPGEGSEFEITLPAG